MKPTLNTFQDTLRSFPVPGQGVHHHILRAAHAGAREGHSFTIIAEQIHHAMPRPPRPGEIEAAVEKAMHSKRPGKRCPKKWVPPSRHPKRVGTIDKAQIIENVQHAVQQAGGEISLDALRQLSPIPLGPLDNKAVQRENAALMLNALHRDDALIFCGDRWDTQPDSIEPAKRWREALSFLPRPLWVPNSFSGKPALMSDGKGSSYRCDNAVAGFQYVLFEIDYPEIPLPVQAAFLISCIRSGTPIRSICYSGGKSLHALIEVGVKNCCQWNDIIIRRLKPKLVAYGADPQAFNPSRLSRLPGYMRDTGRLQSLVWLSPSTHITQNNNGDTP